MIAKLVRRNEHQVDIGVGSVVCIQGIKYAVFYIESDKPEKYALISLLDGFMRFELMTMTDIVKTLEKQQAEYVDHVNKCLMPF